MGNSAATHVATVILMRDISGTAYIFKALHWLRMQWHHAMLQVARCKVVTRWGEGADVVKIVCFLCLLNCKTSKSHALIEIFLYYRYKSCTCAGQQSN